MALLVPDHVITKPGLPSFRKRVVNLIKAAPALIASGGKQVPDAEREWRNRFCANKCPLKLWDKEAYGGHGACTHPKCGCKYKNNFTAMKCPENFWPQYHAKQTTS